MTGETVFCALWVRREGESGRREGRKDGGREREEGRESERERVRGRGGEGRGGEGSDAPTSQHHKEALRVLVLGGISGPWVVVVSGDVIPVGEECSEEDILSGAP